MSDKDGGPAFPAPWTGNQHATGLSVRDYFAGQALGALAAEGLRLNHKSWDATAQHAYFVADAMLKERAK